jgi:hypothetical protein
MAGLPGSPAIVGVPADTPGTPATDQRGFSRNTAAATDMGAFEVQPTDSTVAPTASPGPSAYSQAVTLTATISLTLSGTLATASTVTFFDGSTGLGSPVSVNATSGQATISTTALTAGTRTKYRTDPNKKDTAGHEAASGLRVGRGLNHQEVLLCDA